MAAVSRAGAFATPLASGADVTVFDGAGAAGRAVAGTTATAGKSADAARVAEGAIVRTGDVSECSTQPSAPAPTIAKLTAATSAVGCPMANRGDLLMRGEAAFTAATAAPDNKGDCCR